MSTTPGVAEAAATWRAPAIRVAQLNVLGIATPNFAVQNLDGLVGMNFLRNFNFEIRPEERLIHLELIES